MDKCYICGKELDEYHRWDCGTPVCDSCLINMMQAENERLTKELAIANRALGNCITEGKDNGNYKWLKSATVERIVELYKQQAKKELAEEKR